MSVKDEHSTVPCVGPSPYDPSTIRETEATHSEMLWKNAQWKMPPSHFQNAGMSGQSLIGADPFAHQRETPDWFLVPLVPQDPYGDTTQDDTYANDHVYFRTVHGAGINLALALRGQVDELLDRDRSAFSPTAMVSSKISVRIQFEGRRPYHRQVMALRSTRSAESISLGKLAQKIAEETKACVKGQIISFDGRTVSFDDVYLVKLRLLAL
ncbi:hypothetical protein C8Q77DRAFT_1155001 [Trametes polyzona]|nr:hypothetical protein C8Q77DRAFT_1155001 [Trametes polyzona]